MLIACASLAWGEVPIARCRSGVIISSPVTRFIVFIATVGGEEDGGGMIGGIEFFRFGFAVKSESDLPVGVSLTGFAI